MDDRLTGSGATNRQESDLEREVAARLATARSVVVLTGAGASAESGIRTFRDTMEGLWKEFDAEKLATPGAFAADPGLVSRWYDTRRLGCLAAEPNAGHTALAELERLMAARKGGTAGLTVLTQNVDRLHQRAGSINVVELHGSIIEWRCTKSGRKVTPGPDAMTEFPQTSAWGGVLRPDVVWFGEMLPEAALAAAERAVAACDVFLSVGTSSIVYPAAGFLRAASSQGAVTVEINRDDTPASRSVDFVLRGNCGDVLPRVVGMVKRAHRERGLG